MRTQILALFAASFTFSIGSSHTFRAIREPERRPGHAQLFFNSELASPDPPVKVYGGLTKISKIAIRQLDE